MLNLPRLVSWNDLEAFKKRFRLRVLDVIRGDGADTTIVVETERVVLEHTIIIKAKRGQLGARLVQLCEMARAEPGAAKRVELTRGLRVDAIIERDAFRLQISRKDVYPSMSEWNITVGNLPFDLAGKEPDSMEHKGYYYLRASWPIGSISNEQG